MVCVGGGCHCARYFPPCPHISPPTSVGVLGTDAFKVPLNATRTQPVFSNCVVDVIFFLIPWLHQIYDKRCSSGNLPYFGCPRVRSVTSQRADYINVLNHHLFQFNIVSNKLFPVAHLRFNSRLGFALGCQLQTQRRGCLVPGCCFVY